MAANNHQRTLALRAPSGVLSIAMASSRENRTPTASIVRAHQGSRPHGRCCLRRRPRADELLATVNRYRASRASGDRRRRGCLAGAGSAITARRLDTSCRTSSRGGADGSTPQTRWRRTCSGTAAAMSAARDGITQGASHRPVVVEACTHALMGSDGAKRVVFNSVDARSDGG